MFIEEKYNELLSIRCEEDNFLKESGYFPKYRA
jgi:hypothetical protein